MKGFVGTALAILSVASAQDSDASGLDKRDCAQPVLLQAAAPACQPQVQVAAAPACQPQVQAVQQPVYVQAAQPCAQQITVQQEYSPPAMVYQQVAPVYQQQQQPIYQQPVYQPQPYAQPVYQPAPQPYYYPQQGPFEDDTPGCYSQIGNGLAGASGRFLRYLICPWSFFADACENNDNEYSQPQYAPQYAPQYYPQPQYYQPVYQPVQQQQPQGQWYYNVVPVQSQQNAVLQPVSASLIPDYGLPNGYVTTTTNAIPCA